jgi:hypothetical protein
MQPLGKSVLGPSEAYWDPVVIRHLDSHGKRDITKAIFGDIFEKFG